MYYIAFNVHYVENKFFASTETNMTSNNNIKQNKNKLKGKIFLQSLS